MAAVLLTILAGAVLQDDAEAKSKRVVALIREMVELGEKAEADATVREDAATQKRLRELGEEISKLEEELGARTAREKSALTRSLLAKYAPELIARIWKPASTEKWAPRSLRLVIAAQKDFRDNDRDNNLVNDYWVADVSALYRMALNGRAQSLIKLLEPAIAAADARPCVPIVEQGDFKAATSAESRTMWAMEKAEPREGIAFAVLPGYVGADGKIVRYDSNGSGRNRAKFGVCAYPVEYGKLAKLTWIASEDGVLWKKDTGGKMPEAFPLDPAKEGWVKGE